MGRVCKDGKEGRVKIGGEMIKNLICFMLVSSPFLVLIAGAWLKEKYSGDKKTKSNA